jgi:uncharacterized protein (TIGR03437 family)
MSTNLFRPAPALFSLLIFAGFATPSMAQDSASRIVGKIIWDLSVRFGGPSGIVVAGSDLLHAGAAPGETAGVMQVNVKIPANAPTGNVPLAVIIGDQVSADWVTIAIQ